MVDIDVGEALDGVTDGYDVVDDVGVCDAAGCVWARYQDSEVVVWGRLDEMLGAAVDDAGWLSWLEGWEPADDAVAEAFEAAFEAAFGADD